MPSLELLLLALLADLPGLGGISIRRLLNLCAKPSSIWKASWKTWQQVGVNHNVWEKKQRVDYLQEAERLAAELYQHEVSLLSWEDPEYPQTLFDLYSPPVVLYYQGNLSRSKQSLILAIVGTRRASREGRDISARFAFDLAQLGVGIISGLAKGIDGAAHRGALAGEGYTGAVLGGGHGNLYPQCNQELARKILASGGTLISEYRPTHPVRGPQFKARNRIIAGLVDGVLVVEAPRKSGAIITVDFALELGKEVFVLPGSINNPNWVGSNNLLKDGAKLVTDCSEILAEFGHLGLRMSEQPQIRLSAVEQRIIEGIASEPCTLEGLSASTGLAWGEVIYTVSNLQLQKYISVNSEGRVLPGPLWSQVVSGLQKR